MIRLYFFTICVLITVVVGCNPTSQSDGEGRSASEPSRSLSTDEEKAAYAIGITMGRNVLIDPLVRDLPKEHIYMAIRDMVEDKDKVMNLEEAREYLSQYFEKIHAEQRVTNLKLGQDFLAENAKKEGVTVLSSGLQYEILQDAQGAKPFSTSKVIVHYEGRLMDGTVFDSTEKNPMPSEFPLSSVMEGWKEALQMMSKGSKWRLYVPAELGYGEKPVGQIPPNSVTIFDVELLDIR